VIVCWGELLFALDYYFVLAFLFRLFVFLLGKNNFFLGIILFFSEIVLGIFPLILGMWFWFEIGLDSSDIGF